MTHRCSRRGAIALGLLGGSAALVGARGRTADASPWVAESMARRIPALRDVVRHMLTDPGDAAACLHLRTGRWLFCHHDLVFRQRRMPPGSLMKLVTAYALLEAGLADREWVCTGTHVDTLGIKRPCWLHAGHGPMRLRTALANSCNVWFYEFAQHLQSHHLLHVMDQFGLGRRFPGSSPAVSTDIVPTTIAARDLPDVAIGDDLSMQVTPASLLRVVSLIATRGELLPIASDAPEPGSREPLRVPHLARIAEGMEEAVESGTLKQALGGLDIAGKTGTAKRPGQDGHRGFFAGYLPRQRPQVALVVVKDRGRGAMDAGPVGRALAHALAG